MSRSYTEEEIERALQVRSVVDSASAACHVLSERYELSIPIRTLQQWVADIHRDRYQAIRATIAPKIRQAIASESEDLAQYLVKVERDAIERVETEIPKMDGKDAALALKNLTSAKSAALDKALVLRGEANQIVAQRTPLEIFNAMKELGITVRTAEAIEATAEEIEPAELVPSEEAK